MSSLIKHITSNTLLSFLFLGWLCYFQLLSLENFVWDDNVLFLLKSGWGSGSVAQGFDTDRPLLGRLFDSVLSMVGLQIALWQSIGILARVLTGYFLFLLGKELSGSALFGRISGALFIVTPLLTIQSTAVLATMAFFLPLSLHILSVYLLAVGCRRRSYSLFLISYLLMLIHINIVEYYWASELCKLFLLAVWLLKGSISRNLALLGTALTVFNFVATLAVRLAFFPSRREGTNILHAVERFSPFEFCYRVLNDFVQILILHPINAINSLLEYGFSLGTSLLILALSTSYAWSRKRTVPHQKLSPMFLLFLAMFFVSMLVIWGSSRQFYYGWGGSHFALPCVVWVCFVSTALLLSVNNFKMRSFLVTCTLSVFAVYQFSYSAFVVKDKSYRLASYRQALSELPPSHDPDEFRFVRVISPPRIIMGQYLHLSYIELISDLWMAGAYAMNNGWAVNANDYLESSQYFKDRGIHLEPESVDSLTLFVSYPRTPLDIKNIGAREKLGRWGLEVGSVISMQTIKWLYVDEGSTKQ